MPLRGASRLGQEKLMLPGCDAMTEEEWTAQVAQVEAAWNASGKSTLHGVCAVITLPDGEAEVRQQCRFPNGKASGVSGKVSSLPADGMAPCEDFWYNGICPTLKEGELGYDKCQQTAPQQQTSQPASGTAIFACKSKTVPGSWDLYEPTGGFKGDQGDINVRFLRTVPSMEGYDAPNENASISSANFCSLHSPEADRETQPTPEPTPEPTPTPTPTSQPSEGQAPISIDIQAFTPGGTGPIPTQPLMQPRPAVPPPPAPAPKAVAPAPMPIKPVEKSLDTGSAVGIGAFLVAIGAATFFGGK
jgi:hypothetical protein